MGGYKPLHSAVSEIPVTLFSFELENGDNTRVLIYHLCKYKLFRTIFGLSVKWESYFIHNA